MFGRQSSITGQVIPKTVKMKPTAPLLGISNQCWNWGVGPLNQSLPGVAPLLPTAPSECLIECGGQISHSSDYN